MLYLLRAREMNVSQISDQLQKSSQAIYHQIKKLLDADLIETVKEQRTENFIETYYRATAEIFHLSFGIERGEKYSEQILTITLQGLAEIGLKTRADENLTSQLLETRRRIEAIGAYPEFEKKLELLQGTFLMSGEIGQYVRFILMNDEEFDSWVATSKEFRELLQSSLTHPLDRERLAKSGGARREGTEIDETKRPVVQDYGL